MSQMKMYFRNGKFKLEREIIKKKFKEIDEEVTDISLKTNQKTYKCVGRAKFRIELNRDGGSKKKATSKRSSSTIGKKIQGGKFSHRSLLTSEVVSKNIHTQTYTQRK